MGDQVTVEDILKLGVSHTPAWYMETAADIMGEVIAHIEDGSRQRVSKGFMLERLRTAGVCIICAEQLCEAQGLKAGRITI